MPRPSYKFAEFVDLLLVKLYEIDRDSGRGDFVDLSAIAHEIKGDIPSDWVFDAAKILETRALADCIFTFGGTSAKISGEGRLYVEEERGITRQVQQTPSNYYLTVSGSNNQIVAGNNPGQIRQSSNVGPVSQVAKMLDEMIETIHNDHGISDAARTEAETYTNVLRHEVTKPEPNRSLVASVLEPLSKIASIASNVGSLIKLFNASV